MLYSTEYKCTHYTHYTQRLRISPSRELEKVQDILHLTGRETPEVDKFASNNFCTRFCGHGVHH